MDEQHLILMAGLPGTGKTTVARRLHAGLSGYELISQNEIRRQQRMREMPEMQEDTLRLIDRLTARYLWDGRGVIFDSVNRYLFRRHQMYGIASGCGRRVLTLECVCSEREAKRRMQARPEGDEWLSDPRDPAVYDRLQAGWQDIALDFEFPGEDHVSYLSFDSEALKLRRHVIGAGMEAFADRIEAILTR
jgi:predicted kinase